MNGETSIVLERGGYGRGPKLMPSKDMIVGLEFAPNNDNLLAITYEKSPGKRVIIPYFFRENTMGSSVQEVSEFTRMYFNPAGNGCISYLQEDKSATLWQQQPYTLMHDGLVNQVSMSTDGQFVATACEDNQVVTWQHYSNDAELPLIKELIVLYRAKCKRDGIEPRVFTHQDDLVPWMIETFGDLNQDQLHVMWDKVPSKLKAGVIEWLLSTLPEGNFSEK